MKKSDILMTAALAVGTLCFTACGPENKTETTENETVTTTETKAGDERPSPLRRLEGNAGDASMKLQYGAPSVKGRVVWGDLVPYNEVWRTGANEATNIEFASDVKVEGKDLKAGRYSLFTIPKENGKWTVVFNSEWDLEHGHFQYKEENDVLRVESTPEWTNESQEQLTIAIESPGIVVRWEKMKLPIKIEG